MANYNPRHPRNLRLKLVGDKGWKREKNADICTLECFFSYFCTIKSKNRVIVWKTYTLLYWLLWV